VSGWYTVLVAFWYNSYRSGISYNGLTCALHQPQQMLLVLPIHATCFGRTDHPQAFTYMILTLKIKCVCILSSLCITKLYNL
jgi:hypothetical protein